MTVNYLKALLLLITTFLQPLAHSNGQSQYDMNEALPEMRYVYELLCPTGCGEVVLRSYSDLNNARATYLAAFKTEISFDPQFLGSLRQRFGHSVPLAILAHELGHHLDFNTPGFSSMTDWEIELSADDWAGCALALADLQTWEFEQAMRYSMAILASKTHPKWTLRNAAIRRGYQRCYLH